MATKPVNNPFPFRKAKEFIQQAKKLNLEAVNRLYFSAVMFSQSTIKASLKSYIQFLEYELPKSGTDTEPKKKPVSAVSISGAPEHKKVQDS